MGDNPVSELFHGLVSSDGFMPHGHCYLWNPGLVWLHVTSDGLTAAAYVSIPFTLLYLVRKRKDVPFNWMFLCFGMFIVACGATHIMEIWTLWTPLYWLSGAIKGVTAVASVLTAVLLVRLMPTALAIPSAAALATAHAELRRAHEALELRVAERTAELTNKNAQLHAEMAARKLVSDALAKSESRFRRLAEAGVIGVITADLHGPVLEANGAFLDMVGYTTDDVAAGRLRWQEMTPTEWRTADDRALQQLATTGVATAWEKEYVRKDGRRVPVLVGAAMLDPKADACVAFILDLTERRRAEQAIQGLQQQREADAKFRALLEAAPDAMVIVERDGSVALVNAQAETLFGYARHELLGKSVDMLVPERLRGPHHERRGDYFADPKARAMGTGLELFGRRKDGSEFPVEISLSPLQTKDGLLVSSAIRDITPRRLVEQELRRARDKAEASSRELEAFSYSVAHDLRAPLRAINGYSQALVEDLGAALDPQAREYLDRMGAAATRMGGLIDALLGLSRVSRVELLREPVNLTELATAVVERLRASDPERSVECSVEPGLVARGDPRLLQALLENLLGNAWKFTAAAEHPRVEIGAAEHDGKRAYYVRDNGAGFDMAYAEKLFAPFQRLHSAEQFPGTGVGLATVERIVRRHGGRIWAKGEVERGAAFHFTLDDAGASS